MSDQQTLQDTAYNAFEDAYNLISSEEEWKEVKKNELGDSVVTRKNKSGKNIYRIKAVIDVAPSTLINALKDMSKQTSWNKTLTKMSVLSDVSDDVKVTYQVTTEGGGGIVSARDFVLVVKRGYKGDAFVQAGCSIEYPGAPKDSKIVRAWNGPGGQMVKPIPGEANKCELYWLMDCEYNGMIPASVLSLAMPLAQLQFVECVRGLVKTL